MELLYKYLIVVNIIVISLILNKYLKSEQILKRISMYLMVLIIEYICLSVVFLSLNSFEVSRIIIVMSSINAILLINKMIKKDLILPQNINLKLPLCLIMAIIFILPFIWQKSEVVFPNSDAGSYALKSIDLLHGNTNVYKYLEEYNLVNEEDKDKIVNFQKQQNGLYQNLPMENDEYIYSYHGLPTWPSVMALSGEIFGENNIGSILTVLYVLMLIFLYYILDEFQVNQSSKILSVLILGFSPLSIYLSKNTLTELIWTSIFLFSILSILNKSNFIKIIGAIALGILGFIHVSMFMYLPVITLILFIVQLIKKKKIYGMINIIFNSLFILSLIYGCIVSRLYFVAQYKQAFSRLFNINNDLLFVLVLGGISMLFIIISIALTFHEKINIMLTKIWIFIDEYIFIIIKISVVVLMLYTVYQGYRLGFTDKFIKGDSSWALRASYANKGISSLIHLNIVSILQATSYIVLPIVLVKLFMMKKISNNTKIFAIMLVYSLTLYTVLNVDVPVNYYASRYFFTMIIPSIVLLFGLIPLSKKCKIIVFILVILVNMPFNLVQYKEQEFKNNFEMIDDAMSVIYPDSIVLIDPNSYPEMYMTNLRERNNNLVFPIDVKIDQSLIQNNEVYVISSKNYNTNELSLKFMKEYEITGGISTAKGTYPLEMKKDDINIRIYKLNKEQLNYYPSDGSMVYGFYNVERYGDGEEYRWTSGDSEIQMGFYKGIDKVKIYYGEIPLEKINNNKIEYSISLDDSTILNGELNKDNVAKGYIEIDLSEENINDSFNHILAIKCDTWSPSESGSADTRKLGIPIKKIDIIKNY